MFGKYPWAPVALIALLALGLGACPATDTGEAPTVTDDMVRLAVPDDPTVTFAVSFRVGSQNDPAGKEGLAALTASLIAQGATTENSWDAILEKLYPLASNYTVRVDKEMTTFSGRTHRDNLEAFFGLFSDAYLRPAFAEEDFERLRSVQRNYLEKQLRYASDEELGKAALTAFVFAGTPYAHPIAGTVSGLDSVTLEDVRQFYADHYTQATATAALGGGFDEDLATRFRSTLDLLPAGGSAAVPVVDPPAIEGREVLLVSKSGADASISFGFPIDVNRGERDFYALWIANSWLGEHRNASSHLYEVIREARGLNYGDYSYIEAFPEGGSRQMPPTNVARQHQIFEVWIRTLPNAQAHFALRAAMRELTDLVENGMGEEEFELTRSFLTKYHLHFAKSTEGRLGYAIDDRFYGIDAPGHLAQFGSMMQSITREEVNAALKKHLNLDNIKIAMVTGDAENLAQALVEDRSSPIEYATPKGDEILEDDKSIIDLPLGIAEGAVTIVPVEEFAQ